MRVQFLVCDTCGVESRNTKTGGRTWITLNGRIMGRELHFCSIDCATSLVRKKVNDPDWNFVFPDAEEHIKLWHNWVVISEKPAVMGGAK